MPTDKTQDTSPAEHGLPLVARLQKTLHDPDDGDPYWDAFQPNLLQIVACSLADDAINHRPAMRAAFDDLLKRIEPLGDQRHRVESSVIIMVSDACKLGALVGIQVAQTLDIEGTYAAIGRLADLALTPMDTPTTAGGVS